MFQTYIADGIKAITSNTAKRVGGYELKRRYSEVISQKHSKKETRTGDEIINHMKARLANFEKEGN